MALIYKLKYGKARASKGVGRGRQITILQYKQYFQGAFPSPLIAAHDL